MPRYRATVAYDGTAYAGWQVQPNAITVQQKIQDVLLQLTETPVLVHGSGRTDQGVHARGQVFHFDLANPWKPKALLQSMNALLPPDIRLSTVKHATPDFHARRSAISKEYRYFIWNADVLPPHIRHYRSHVRRQLDVDAMNAAAAYLVGRLDFAAFTANPNRMIESTVRQVTKVHVRRRGHEFTVIVAGEGFLYKMVRSIAGYLIRVGEGAVAPESVAEVLASRTRTADVPTAPPEGLFLWKVSY